MRSASALLIALIALVVVGESSRHAISDERGVPPTETALVSGVEPDDSLSAMLGDRLDVALSYAMKPVCFPTARGASRCTPR